MKILIVSPFFPPDNTPDMHRVRISIPYFMEAGHEIYVLRIASEYTCAKKDEMLTETIPSEIKIYSVKPINLKITRKIGIGNIGIRSFFQLLKMGNKIIKQEKPDLIFFSTTVFTILELGAIWKKKFNIPFVIDLQDPWRNDYYLSLPAKERPPKYFFYYQLNKFLEAYTIPMCAGILSVTDAYIDMLRDRYKDKFIAQTIVLPLGVSQNDFKLVKEKKLNLSINFSADEFSVVYTGVVPDNMLFAIEALIIAVKKYNLTADRKMVLYFIGTNYVSKNLQEKKLLHLIKKYQMQYYLVEKTDRASYFEAIQLMLDSDLLLLPGTLDNNYSASKIYPYILSEKKILVVFNKNSELKNIINEITNLPFVGFDNNTDLIDLSEKIYHTLIYLLNDFDYKINWEKFEKYTAKSMTQQLISFFNEIINKNIKKIS
jgi:glycosyltransferase involved in cell wall biosynthesis